VRRRELLRLSGLAFLAPLSVAGIRREADLIVSNNGQAGDSSEGHVRCVDDTCSDFLESVGVNTHLSYSHTPWENVERYGQLFADLGVKHIREGIDTTPTPPSAKTWRLMRLRILRAFTPDLKVSGVTTPQTIPANLEYALRLMGGVEYLEGWNEPPGTSPSVSAQTALFSAVRAQNLPVKVLGPSYVGSAGKAVGDISGLVDYGNIHPYTWWATPEIKGGLSAFSDPARTNFGNKPLVATEAGYNSAMRNTHIPATPEDVVARYIPRLLLFYWMSGIKRTYLYELVRTHPVLDTDPESAFGLIRQDYSVTPAYTALKSMMNLFKGGSVAMPKALVVTLQSNDAVRGDVYVCVFQRFQNEYLLSVWLGETGWDVKAQQRIEVEPKSVELHFGKPCAIAETITFGDDGILTRSAPPEPEVVRRYTVRVTDRVTVFRIFVHS
jgi:hypothetical protein